jgi:hypothetical protein
MKKPTIRKTGDRHKDLKLLGADKLAQLDAMLFKGIKFASIADHIQEVWGDFKEVDKYTLSKKIERYNDDEIVGKWVVNIADENGQVKENYMKPIREHGTKVNAYELLKDLVLVQQKRLNKIMVREEQLPTLMNSVRQEIDTYGKLIINLSELEMDLGYAVRAPIKIEANIKAPDEKTVLEAERVSREKTLMHQQAESINKVLSIITTH